MPVISISLSDAYNPIVAKGDVVQSGQVLAHTLLPKEHAVNVPSAMDIPLKQVKHVLKVQIGDTIARGDVIAEKKNIFGKRKAVIISSLSGTITRYDRMTGDLIVQEDQKIASNEIISPVAGTIDLCNNKEIIIATDNVIAGLQASSESSATGELFILSESFRSSGNHIAYYLDSRASDKVILGGTITRDVLIKGNGIGVKGFIAVVIRDSDIDYLREKKISMPVVTITQNDSEILKALEGHTVTLDGGNKIIIY